MAIKYRQIRKKLVIAYDPEYIRLEMFLSLEPL